MPFRRRRRRTRPRRRGRFSGRRPMRRTRRVTLDPERKTLSLAVGATASTTARIDFLNGCPQGITQNDRIGRQSVNIGWTCRFTATINGTDPVFIRIMLVSDSQPDGAPPLLGQILENPGLPAVSTRNLDTRQRFRMLWQKTFSLEVFNDTARYFNVNKSFRITSRWDGPGGNIGDCQSGAIFLIMVSTLAVANTPPSVTFNSRLRFVG